MKNHDSYLLFLSTLFFASTINGVAPTDYHPHLQRKIATKIVQTLNETQKQLAPLSGRANEKLTADIRTLKQQIVSIQDMLKKKTWTQPPTTALPKTLLPLNAQDQKIVDRMYTQAGAAHRKMETLLTDLKMGLLAQRDCYPMQIAISAPLCAPINEWIADITAALETLIEPQ